MLILDSGGLSRLTERSSAAAALISALQRQGLWPPIVPTPVLVESLTGSGSKDAVTNRLLKACDIVEEIPESLAREAARIRYEAQRGSAVDALLVALADPGGSVLTADSGDLLALAGRAHNVQIVNA